MEKPRNFERGPKKIGSKEELQETELFKQEGEIYKAESREEKELPDERPQIVIKSVEEVQDLIEKNMNEAIEKGTVGPMIFAYPSGLTLQLNPFFDGNPSIENFTGYYKGSLIIPKEYDKKQQQGMSKKEIDQRISESLQEVSLQPSIIYETLSESQKKHLSYMQNVSIVPAKEFFVTSEPIADKWIIGINAKSLQESERSIFAIFHELGHIPHIELEDELVSQALKKEVETDKIFLEKPFDDFIKGASGYISAIREDLEQLDPEIVLSLERDIKEALKLRSDYSQSRKGASVIRKFKEEQDIRRDIFIKILIFAERMADARAAAFARRLRFPEHGGVDLEFKTTDDMREYYHKALETYAKHYKDPRFMKGLRKKQ